MSVTWTIVDRAGWETLAQLAIHSYTDCTTTTAGTIVAESNYRVTRRLRLSDAEFYLKRFEFVGARQRHRFRRDPATVEAANYVTLRETCGVPTPDIVAFGAERRGARLVHAVLITRGVSGAVPLDGVALSAEAWPRIAAVLTPVVARMHAHHFFHCDLEWRNVLVRHAAGDPEVFIIDSSRGGVRRSALLRRHGRIRDLHSLDRVARRCLSRTQRLRWLHGYLAASADTAALNIRSLLRALIRYSARKGESV